jgi:hypothetical protein
MLERVMEVLGSESGELRPSDREGRPGGLLYLEPDLPTVIVPDLHARMDLLLCLLMCSGEGGATLFEKLADGRLQVVCVGDGFHAEARAAQRWKLALDEYENDYAAHRYIDQEMRESFGVMEMVMELKCAYPRHFHFLKGNHENIANELGEGNYPFRKFAQEGRMVARYVEKFYGRDLLESYALFEKLFPVLAVGRNFLISHAEPEFYVSPEEVIDYRFNAEVVEGLTWTPNDGAEEGSVAKMLQSYLISDRAAEVYYFGGHRPVSGLYAQRAGGRYVQIHNPGRFIIACLPAEGPIDLDRDVLDIQDEVTGCREQLESSATPGTVPDTHED